MTGEHPALALACDIDDTLLSTGNPGVSAQYLEGLCAVIQQQRADLNRPFYFGTVTGRTLESHIEREQQVPALAAATSIMDFKITAVGAEPYILTPAGAVPMPGWPEAPGWDREAITGILSGRSELQMQSQIAQRQHKISFDVSGVADSSHDSYVREVERQLAQQRLGAQVIFSSGMFLDILPTGVNKGTALARTVGALVMQRPAKVQESTPANVFIAAAGDSMNDRDLLQAADLAILPGNAHRSLREWAQNTVPRHKLYIAEAKFAAGILEGLRQHNLVTG